MSLCCCGVVVLGADVVVVVWVDGDAYGSSTLPRIDTLCYPPTALVRFKPSTWLPASRFSQRHRRLSQPDHAATNATVGLLPPAHHIHTPTARTLRRPSQFNLHSFGTSTSHTLSLGLQLLSAGSFSSIATQTVTYEGLITKILLLDRNWRSLLPAKYATSSGILVHLPADHTKHLSVQ